MNLSSVIEYFRKRKIKKIKDKIHNIKSKIQNLSEIANNNEHPSSKLDWPKLVIKVSTKMYDLNKLQERLRILEEK